MKTPIGLNHKKSMAAWPFSSVLVTCTAGAGPCPAVDAPTTGSKCLEDSFYQQVWYHRKAILGKV